MSLYRKSDPLEGELKTASRIVFTNSKESTLRITVSDPQAIGQIASIIGKKELVQGTPGVESDYVIKFYLPSGKQIDFAYWLGSSDNGKEVNFQDGQGNFYRIPESIDLYIVNSTKMLNRPDNFAELYSKTLSECISGIEKLKEGPTIIGVDITSDRRMRKYTMSYEDEKILNGIDAEGYTILPYKKDGSFTYVVSYVTNIYAPAKASIAVEVLNTADKTIKKNNVDYILKDGVWQHPPAK
jgi:hypothetical protein